MKENLAFKGVLLPPDCNVPVIIFVWTVIVHTESAIDRRRGGESCRLVEVLRLRIALLFRNPSTVHMGAELRHLPTKVILRHLVEQVHIKVRQVIGCKVSQHKLFFALVGTVDLLHPEH
eukprot:30733-Amphidinium_carterae.1